MHTDTVAQCVLSLVPRPRFPQLRMDYITATWKVGLTYHVKSRSGDVIHPQLWESGSGYETSAYCACMQRQNPITCHCINYIMHKEFAISRSGKSAPSFILI